MQDDMRQYRDLFHAGEFHAAHDALEPRWIATRSHTLQGLIQMAVGWHHLSQGNLHGARVLWTKALSHLNSVDAEPSEGIALEPIREHLRHALAVLPRGRRLEGRLPGINPPVLTVEHGENVP